MGRFEAEDCFYDDITRPAMERVKEYVVKTSDPNNPEPRYVRRFPKRKNPLKSRRYPAFTCRDAMQALH
jgi:hypothetical protein